MTGAAGGMGRALCMRLGREGAHLGLVDRDEAALKQVQLDLERAGVRCAAAPADVRSRDQLRAAIDTVTKALAPVDICVAAAGVCGISSADDLRVPVLEEMLQVNFLGRGRDEPMTAPPSRESALLLKVTPGGVLEGLMK